MAKPYYEIIEDLNGLPFDAEIIPAWSLHRLIEMIGDPYDIHGDYDDAINFLDWLIKEGYFNKDYLV